MTDALAQATFTLSDVKAALREPAITRGKAYAKDGRVKGVRITNGGNAIVARVSGSRTSPYAVTIYVSRGRGARTIISGIATVRWQSTANMSRQHS